MTRTKENHFSTNIFRFSSESLWRYCTLTEENHFSTNIFILYRTGPSVYRKRPILNQKSPILSQKRRIVSPKSALPHEREIPTKLECVSHTLHYVTHYIMSHTTNRARLRKRRALFSKVKSLLKDYTSLH